MDIEDKILTLIKSNENGILQNELWKSAKIDSSKCSRIVARLAKEGKISREHDSSRGSKTFLIKYLEKKEKKTMNYKLLLVENMFSPCTGCSIECVPEHCISLSEWVYLL